MRLQNEENMNIRDHEYFKVFKDKSYASHKKCPTAIAWNTIGSMLVTAEVGAKLWQLSEEGGLDKIGEFKAHDTNNIESAQFCNANLLGMLSRDTMKYFDIRENGKSTLIKAQKRNKVDYVRFAWNNTRDSESAKVAILNKQNTVLLFDFRNMSTPLTQITPKQNTSQQICAVSWDKSDSVLFLVGGESNIGSISLYSAESFESIGDPINVHCGRITDIAFSPDNEKFATVSEDSLLEIHCIPEIICERVFSNKTDSQYKRVSFSSDSKFVATSSDSNSIDIYNAREGGQAFKLKCSFNQEILSWHPKKNILAYVDEEDKGRSVGRGEEQYVHLFS